MMDKKALRIDFILLLGILLISIISFGVIFGFDRLFGGPLDFQVYATYYVVSTIFVIELFFFTLTSIVFLLKQLITRFKSRSGNTILVASVLLLSAMAYFIFNM